MNKLMILLAAMAVVTGCCANNSNDSVKVKIINSNLKFNEGSVVYGDGLLISNFGGEELNPLNNEGKGYIVKMVGDKVDVLIPADGTLSGPKGMAISGDNLFIADVQKVVVYNLADPSVAPKVIAMPEGNLFVNDIVIKDNTAYISVTNTGKIFTLDISDISLIDETKLVEYIDVVGANGLILDGSTMYIASYPADGVTVADNVIYEIKDIAAPQLTKLITREGQYDGLALVGRKLYFTSWVNGEVGFVNLDDNNLVTLLNLKDYIFAGPADMTYFDGKLYIPNLPNSEIGIINISNDATK